jgi:predicted nucleotidyltransferase
MDANQVGILDRMIARIVETMNPEAIYLFGSRAPGDARPNSDYDHLVIVSDDAPVS